MHGIDPAARSDTPVGSPIAHTDGIANSMVRTRRHDAGDLGHEAKAAEGGDFDAARATHHATAAE